MRAPPPGVRLVINRQKRGRKASTPSQTEPHVEHVAMDSESEGAYVRVVMETLPTLARISLPKRQAAGPKRGRSQGHTINSCMVSTRKETRRKAHVLRSRKMDTRNGVTRRWLSGVAGAGVQAVRPDGRDGSRSKGLE